MKDVGVSVDELLVLDLLTLRAHTEQAGDALHPERHAAQLRTSLQSSEVCGVRRAGALVAYAMLSRDEAGTDRWFVRAFNIHPEHRTAPVIGRLLRRFAEIVERVGARELRSHVYKTNAASLAFHRRLGFRVVRENAKAVEFTASMPELAGIRCVAGWRHRSA